MSGFPTSTHTFLSTLTLSQDRTNKDADAFEARHLFGDEIASAPCVERRWPIHQPVLLVAPTRTVLTASNVRPFPSCRIHCARQVRGRWHARGRSRPRSSLLANSSV